MYAAWQTFDEDGGPAMSMAQRLGKRQKWDDGKGGRCYEIVDYHHGSSHETEGSRSNVHAGSVRTEKEEAITGNRPEEPRQKERQTAEVQKDEKAVNHEAGQGSEKTQEPCQGNQDDQIEHIAF